MRGAISGSNEHQVVVETQQAGEVDRLQETIADAARAVRDRFRFMPLLDRETFKPTVASRPSHWSQRP